VNAGHDVRSVRSWLNQMYPDVDILIQRNAQHQKKSYFFIQDAREKFEDTGKGFFNTVRTINIHLITEGKSIDNPASDDAYWKTRAVIDYLRDRLLRERTIPQFLYNMSWFPVVGWTKSGGALTAGTYELACTSIDRFDKESTLSGSQMITVGANEKLYLALANWPLGNPLNKSLVVYHRTASDQPWKAIKVVPMDLEGSGSTVTEITSFAPLDPVRNPPTSSKQWMGYLKVDTCNASMMESIMVDDAFHGFVNVTFRSRAPQMFRTVPRLNTASTTISVS
jgi:hypothetical protein